MAIDKKKLKRIMGVTSVILLAVFVGMRILARKKKPSSVYEDEPSQQNLFVGKRVILVEDENDKKNADGVRGHLEAVGEVSYNPGFYEKTVKRVMDVVLSFGGLILLSPVFAAIALAIKIEDPGPVLFTQKRVGRNKQFFMLHKFRSMKMSTPHDVPTHQLENPEQYITKVGKFLRAHSLDELPQIWDIFVGNMSVIGPRPGLWNQDLLTAERDKYGANDVKPGLTGWAQINGRDELEISEKAKLDGEYVKKIGALMDIKCFLGSIHVFGKDDSVIEGCMREKKGGCEASTVCRHYTDGKSDEELIGHIGFSGPVEVDREGRKKVLITGAGSYIGDMFQAYAAEHYPDNFYIDTLDMLNPVWRAIDFSSYDIVYHVAGIAHADVGNISDEGKEKYYSVNTDLAIEVAKMSKEAGVKEFIFMSSMIVYGESAPYRKKKVVDEHTVPSPANFYGDSKLQADVGVRVLADDKFKVIVLRPPMIYGKGSKGNYPILAKLAKKLPVFPGVDNEKSMLYIENLCEFLCQIMLVKEIKENAVVLVPQNAEWTRTGVMVREIARVSGGSIRELGVLKLAVLFANKVPGKIGGLVNKAFGNSCYKHEMSEYPGVEYQKVMLAESIRRTEGNTESIFAGLRSCNSTNKGSVLVLASVASMIDQFNMSNIAILQDLGYRVDVACNFEKGNTCSQERVKELKKRLDEINVDYYQIDFTRNVMNLPQEMTAYKQVKEIVLKNRYNFVHCHSPIGGVVGRLICHETNTKVIYTAHGFHFYDGAPLKNWIIYYPIEKFLSRYTDVLITINKEDYKRATKKLHAKKTVYIPGVGVDTEKFASRTSGRERIRTELGLKGSDIMLLSVGELNENKNHENVIRGIKGLKVTYVIAGKGEKEEELENIAKECGVDLRLVGFRTDVSDFYDAADVYVLPSIREGLNVSLMEAMATGLSCAVSKIRGNTDLIDDEAVLFNPMDTSELRMAVKNAIEQHSEYGKKNLEKIRGFDLSTVKNLTSEIYAGGGAKHLIELLKNQEKRKEIRVPLDAKLLISVGELSVRKNHRVVVEALRKLPSDYWYVIVGKGDLKDELEAMDKTGRLRLLGFRTDVVELLHCSDLFVFPSLQEGLPVALMEAMASGLPCVASRIRGNTDLIENDECLFEAKDAESLKFELLSNIAGRESWRTTDSLSRHIFESFSVKTINCTMIDIYKRMR